jgi:ABC-type enterochelin transport system permease subunit
MNGPEGVYDRLVMTKAEAAITRLSACGAARAAGMLLALSGVLSGQITINEFSIPTTNSTPFRITSGPDGNLWFTEYNGNKIGQVVLPRAAAVPTLSGWSLALCGILLVALGALALLVRPRRHAAQ